MDDIQVITLEDGDVAVKLISLGCITQSWQVPWENERRQVVLGYEDAQSYLADKTYCGIIAGRVANRIADGQFTLAGEIFHLAQNEGAHTLHGGPKALGTRHWAHELDGGRSVRFTYCSPDGEQGFPGKVDFSLTVTLDKSTLSYVMEGNPDRPTPISLAQHNYYNLLGAGDIWGHSARIRASRYTEKTGQLLPTGSILPVAGSALDFTSPITFGAADPEGLGTDDNLVVDAEDGPVAEVSVSGGPRLRMWSDQPGMQLYTGKYLSAAGTPHQGQSFAPFSGFALEPQNFPNAVNVAGFPSPLATPEQPYEQVLRVEIA